MWNSKSSVKLKSQIGLQLWKNLDDDDDDDDDLDINKALENIVENVKASATESLSYCELKQRKS
jgi:hypothetical protein